MAESDAPPANLEAQVSTENTQSKILNGIKPFAGGLGALALTYIINFEGLVKRMTNIALEEGLHFGYHCSGAAGLYAGFCRDKLTKAYSIGVLVASMSPDLMAYVAEPDAKKLGTAVGLKALWYGSGYIGGALIDTVLPGIKHNCVNETSVK